MCSKSNLKVVGIIQVRMGSTRFPRKAMAIVEGKPVIQHIIDLVKNSKKIDKIVIATSKNKKDDTIASFAKKTNIACFRGSEENVLDRIYKTAKKYNVGAVVRICADNLFLDVETMDKMIDELIGKRYDYITNACEKGLPLGTVSEVVSMKALEIAWKKAKRSYQREHVTPFIKESPKIFKIKYFEVPKWLQRQDIKLALDTKKDIDLIRILYKRFYEENKLFNLKLIINFLDKNPAIKKINQ